MKRFYFVILCTLLFLSGCNTPAQSDEAQYTATDSTGAIAIQTSGEQIIVRMFAMDTLVQVTLYDSKLSEEQIYDIMGTVSRLERIFSATDEESELFQLNLTSNERISVSNELQTLVSFAVDISEQTNGCFDVSAYPLIRAWGFTKDEYRIPSETELSELLPTVDYRNIQISDTGICLQGGTKIDLGALAKGYTGDILAEKLKENGVERGIISLGGNITVIGEKSENTGWKVGIRNPIETTENIGYLELSDCNVITSGGYERYFEGDDGELYWHIIDPKTGYPAKNGLLSVTVIGENGMLCDALSTALFVMGEEDAIDFYRKHDGFEFILVAEGGTLLVTDGIANRFTSYDRTTEIVTISK